MHLQYKLFLTAFVDDISLRVPEYKLGHMLSWLTATKVQLIMGES